MSNNWERFKEITGGTIHQIAEELLTPPMIAAVQVKAQNFSIKRQKVD